MARIEPSERSPISLRLEDWWLSLRGDDQLPHRDKFDLLEQADLIPDMIAVEFECDGPPSLNVIFSGSNHAIKSGVEITGMNALEMFGRSDPHVLQESITQMITRPCGLIEHNEVQYKSGQHYIVEFTMFPLAGGFGKPDVIVVATNFLEIMIRGEKSEASHLDPSHRWSWIDVGAGVAAYDDEFASSSSAEGA